MPAFLTSVQTAECVHRVLNYFCAASDEVRSMPTVVCFAEGYFGSFLVGGESRISESSDSASRFRVFLDVASRLRLLGSRI